MARKGKKAPVPFLRWFLGQIFRTIRKFGNITITWTGIGICVYWLSSALKAFAGHSSNANLAFSFVTNISFVWSASISVSGVSIALYWKEMRQHRATRKRLAERNRQLELRIDPTRTSSLLTPQGLTRKEDE